LYDEERRRKIEKKRKRESVKEIATKKYNIILPVNRVTI